jgi:hypothetical protein
MDAKKEKGRTLTQVETILVLTKGSHSIAQVAKMIEEHYQAKSAEEAEKRRLNILCMNI